MAPAVGVRLRASLPQALPPRQAAGHDLRDKIGYAAAAALTAAALLAAALRPGL